LKEQTYLYSTSWDYWDYEKDGSSRVLEQFLPCPLAFLGDRTRLLELHP
jgi:hypothetical protein